MSNFLFLSGHYTLHLIDFDFLKSTNKLCNVITTNWHFQQIENWFQLIEKFKLVQTFQVIESKNEGILLCMKVKTR